jgi:hypothetical protein
MVGAYAVTVVKYVAFIGLFLGVSGVCSSIMTMTPETCLLGRPEFSIIKDGVRYVAWSFGVLLIALILSSAKVIGLAVKFAVESVDDILLGIQITVGSANLNVFRGYVNITGLVANNPEDYGFITPYLAKIDKAVVKINMGKLVWSLGGSFELTEISIEGVDLNFEKGRGMLPSNVGAVLRFLEKGERGKQAHEKLADLSTSTAADALAAKAAQETPSGAKAADHAGKRDDASEEKPKKEEKAGVEVILRHLRISDIKAQIVDPRFGKLAMVDLGTLDIPELSHVGKEGVANIVKFIVKTLLRTVAQNASIMGSLVTAGCKKVATTVCGNCDAAGPKQRPSDQPASLASGRGQRGD